MLNFTPVLLTGITDVFYGTGPPKKGGNVFTVELDAYEVVQLQSSGDLTGTNMKSDKPIGVFSGNVGM